MQNSLQIAYEYYKEKFDSKKHKPFLCPQEFSVFIQMYADIPKLLERVCQYYDNKFVITELKDKNGNLIGFL
jgi:hypothetical protein